MYPNFERFRPVMPLSESHICAKPAKPVEMVSTGLEPDRRKTTPWVPNPEFYGDLPLLIGFDSEWQVEGESNRALSYQFFALDFAGGGWQGIYYPRGNRIGLIGFLSWVVLEGLSAGRIKKWPLSIVLVAHWTLADLAMLKNFAQFKTLLDAVRRTFITVKDTLTCNLWDGQRHCHKVKLIVRDSMLLAPNGKQALSDLGELVGLEKIELEDGEIENMAALLASDPDRFKAYAQRDPEICVRYVIRMMALNLEVAGKAEVPPTLSSVGIKFLLRRWKELGIDQHAVLGTEVVETTAWSPHLQRRLRRREVVLIAERHLHESFATECYSGGRNEQYLFGAGVEGTWTDWDLSGAYATAMSIIGLPGWHAIRQTRDLDEFQPQTMGFARLRFRFPVNTLFPCLPIRTPVGLVFPLEGESYCASPEVYTALRLGAQLEIVDGFILPASFNVRPFEAFVIECTRRRKQYVKGSLDELLWKELANSTYGKTAQGLRRKRVFDSRSGERVDLPPSQITNPYFAAFTTSLVRAVLGEILAALPLNRAVCNATTDGFLTDATDAEVHAATEGPLCRLFAQARLRICGDPTVVERKHRIAQPLGWRTRGQATLKAIEGEKPVLAKAGLKPPMKDKAQHNAWIVDTFINRTADSKQTITTLRNLPEIWKQGGDLTRKEIVRRINMDFDWKRRPVNSSTRPIHGTEHLCFETVPWRSVVEFQACRDQWEQFHGTTGTVLKTVEDLASFDDYRAVDTGSTGLKRSRKDSAITLAKRMFLRAYTRSVWGLDVHAMSYAELARWLTDAGYKTAKADLENAKRPSAKLVGQIVPLTPVVEKFIILLQSQFPGFDPAMMLQPTTRTCDSVLPVSGNNLTTKLK